MMGDHSTFLRGFEHEEEVQDQLYYQILCSYMVAIEISRVLLSPVHPLRLSLVLNLAYFYSTIGKNRDRACDICRQARDEAEAEMETMSETLAFSQQQDAVMLLQMMSEFVPFS
eukprot:TRINITY_DN15977_c0_g1_i2.p1 TRINITY_DN15977_c0_g1~~TRINITY_DN15977_c0_g1_i2.p1  ORF type:complete len:132 (-),score=18.73 TRINITY_DN15977_c0_g1_i2:97-438(-)